MTVPTTDYLPVAIEAANAAAAIQQAGLGERLEIATKSSDIDLVTHVDKASEAAIREIIRASYPDHVVLGEEQGQPEGSSRYRWIVDPLDGTLNYAHGFPYYCVSIALEIDGITEVGLVLNSVNGETFTAIRGGGAFLDGEAITVTGEAVLKRAILATGFAYIEDAIMENMALLSQVITRVRGVRRPGAAALDLAHVACGRLDGHWELALNPWDVAAGVLLIQEAGGTATDQEGSPYRLGQNLLVATNGHIHEELLGLLSTPKAAS